MIIKESNSYATLLIIKESNSCATTFVCRIWCNWSSIACFRWLCKCWFDNILNAVLWLFHNNTTVCNVRREMLLPVCAKQPAQLEN